MVHHFEHRYRSKQTKKIKELEACMLKEPTGSQPFNESKETGIAKRGNDGTIEMLPVGLY